METMEHEIHETFVEHERNMNKTCMFDQCQRWRSWGLGPLNEVSHLQEASGGQNLPWSQLAMLCHASSTDHPMVKLERSHEALLRWADLTWLKWIIDENWASTPHFATLIHLRSKRSQWQRSTRLWPATGTELPRKRRSGEVDQVKALTFHVSCGVAVGNPVAAPGRYEIISPKLESRCEGLRDPGHRWAGASLS